MKTTELKAFRTNLKKDVLKNYGKRCKERAFGCYKCDIWVLLDLLDAYVLDRVEMEKWTKDFTLKKKK